ncbi:alpha-1-inhibitor 3-like [Penaeus indicus]|uniref:alpha-1-inhibitor 3-like n=1 Tax=Penaeus indicus TaxID=29960 RepID=UPI00300C1D74
METSRSSEVMLGCPQTCALDPMKRLQKTEIRFRRVDTCYEVFLPEKDHFSGKLRVSGRAGGVAFEDTRDIWLPDNRNLTFVQTDKYLYQPGQEVKFRVLTLQGWQAKVTTDPYPEIWVETPSNTRVAQWIGAASPSGLLHLAFQLADEPEEGLYTIHVRGPGTTKTTRSFKVEEFVLPRFEVKVTPPKYALATDEIFTFNVCANYTFGQPLKGTVELTVTNNQRRRCRNIIKRTESIAGCKDISVAAKELRIIDCRVFRLSATAVVEEDGTGVRLNDTASASISRTAVNFVTVYEDNYKKPNLPFTLKVKATLPDDSPAAGVPVEVCAAGVCANKTTAQDGVFTAVVASDDTNRIFMSTLNCRADLRASTFSKEIRQYYSPSNSSLLLQVPEKKLKCEPGQSGNYNLPVWFSANNQPRAALTVQVVSRGKIQHLTTQQVSFTPSAFPIDAQNLVDAPSNPGFPIVMGVLNLPISLPPTASPTAQVLIWYTRDDGEVVSDAAELKLERCLDIAANLSFSARQALPGGETTVALSSEPNAICSVGVVDKSTELLNPDPTPISLDAIFRYLEGYKIFPWINPQVDDSEYCERKAFEKSAESVASGGILFAPFPRFAYYTEYVDALTMFDAAGVHVISNLILETRPCEKDDGGADGFGPIGITGDIAPNRIQGGFAAGFGGASIGAAKAPTQPEEAEGTAPRTLFPETWLWELVAVPASGLIQDRLKLPDTITEWVGQAVCAHADKGVGLSERASITAFTPFFTDLTLPPSVKRGEVLPVKISVFNYLDQPLPVRVILQASPEYQVVEDPAANGGGAGGAGNERASCLAPQDKAVHTIKIRTLALGDVNLTVSAFVDSALAAGCGGGTAPVARRDTLIKPITVEAEGFPREQTWTKYLCAEEVASGEDAPDTWEIVPPANIVPDSARAWVTSVGDLLALSLENLGYLIRHPSGCGEQNMVNFAPNIYMLQYLTATEQGTPEITEKLLRFMRTGYQRELLYRRDDSSYSAFGNADDSGSTWLTAFVLKSFAQARRFISVDTESLDQTRLWLSNSTRDPSGCIDPVGKVFSKGLTGGLAGRSSTVPLTAYVLIALLEAGVPINTPIVLDAGRCVLADSSNDPYTLALKAYALALAKDPNAQRVIQDLLSLAVVENNALYWNLPQGPRRSKALQVETAGYAILALMAQDPVANALQARQIVKWITSKRNGQGGFYSTQDTVVALQALASYETHTFQGPLNVVATVTATDLSHSFTLTEQNKLLQQLVKLPSLPTSVSISMEGQGCAVMQAVLRYNVPEAEPSDAFSLRVQAVNDPRGGCVEKRLEACSAYLLPDGRSNMAVIEVNLVSGFIPSKDDLKEVVRRNPKVVKRYEVDGSKVTFYIEEFTAQEVCVSFRITRDVEIEDAKPGSVVVYDYYQPEFSVSKSYSFPFLDGCQR